LHFEPETVARLKEIKLRTAAELLEQKVGETLTYSAYPWFLILQNLSLIPAHRFLP
jgi:hypothetical protein